MLAVVCCTFIAQVHSATAQTAASKHQISAGEAAQLIGAYQTSQTATKLASWGVHAGTLPTNAVRTLLSRKGATALYYSWGLDDNNQLQVIYTAKREDGTEILEPNSILCPRRMTVHTEMDASNILTLAEATAMRKRYEASALYETHKKLVGGVLPTEAVELLLKNRTNAGIRGYFGLTGRGTPTLVLVGTTTTANDNSELFLDRSGDCPPVCKEP